jgi:hypothetical protein
MSVLRVCIARGCSTRTLGVYCLAHEIPAASLKVRPGKSAEAARSELGPPGRSRQLPVELPSVPAG